MQNIFNIQSNLARSSTPASFTGLARVRENARAAGSTQILAKSRKGQGPKPVYEKDYSQAIYKKSLSQLINSTTPIEQQIHINPRKSHHLFCPNREENQECKGKACDIINLFSLNIESLTDEEWTKLFEHLMFKAIEMCCVVELVEYPDGITKAYTILLPIEHNPITNEPMAVRGYIRYVFHRKSPATVERENKRKLRFGEPLVEVGQLELITSYPVKLDEVPLRPEDCLLSSEAEQGESEL